MRSRIKQAAPYIAFFLVFAVSHGLNLGSTVTADEPAYVQHSAAFFHALANGELEETFRLYHPGVPTLWLGTLAYTWILPEYAEADMSLLPGLKFALFFEQHGAASLELLALSHAFALLLNAALLTLGFYLLGKSLDQTVIWIGMLLVALDPFYFEFARILGVDGLMSSALFASFAAYWAYWRTQRRAYVLAAGALLGLAILTKVSALALGPFILAAELVWLYTNRKKGIQLRHKAVDAALLSGIVALTCFALWPVLWVAPLESAGRVLDYSFSTSSGDASLNSPQFFNGRLYPSGEFDNALFYPITLLWRSSPIILIGLALTLTFLVNRRGDISGAIPGALGFALLFIVLMTVSTKRFDRYILPVYLFLDLAAAWGLVEWGKRFSRRARLGGLAALSLAGAAMLVQTHPYYLSYYNPVMRLTNAPQNVLGIGWGEGMNEAAQFLNEQPDIYNQTIFAWYPEALKFHLNSHPAQPQQIQYAQEVGDVDYNDALSADWVVIYINLAQRELAKPITDHYAAQTPAKVITINGIDYVKIYRNP